MAHSMEEEEEEVEDEEEGATAGLQAIKATQVALLSLLLPLKVALTLIRHMCYIHNIFMLYILIATVPWNTPLPVGASYTKY